MTEIFEVHTASRVPTADRIDEEACTGIDRLDERQCLALLGEKGVGRVAVTIGALPVILPVRYRKDDGDILFFVGDGKAETAALSGTVVAFETNWRDLATKGPRWSVHVVGTAHVVSDPREVDEAVEHGLCAFRPGGPPRLVRFEPGLISGWRLATVDLHSVSSSGS